MKNIESRTITELNKAMDAKIIDILDDQPDFKAEFFNFDAYAQSMTKIITNEKTGTPLVIGIFGDWGSGKTSLMRKIQTELDVSNSTTIWFNAWKYNTDDAIWRALLISIIEKLKINRKEDKNDGNELDDLQNSLYYDVQREELGSLKFYPGKAIAILVKSILSEIPLIRRFIDVEKGNFNELFEIFQREKKEINIKKIKFIEEFHGSFKHIIKNHFEKRVVIFIDDLDRCSPEKAIEVLEAIKLFLDVEGCIFIIGIDRRVISKGIELKYKGLTGNNNDFISGENYLEKIIQLDFFLPKIPEEKVKEFIQKNSELSEDYYDIILKGIEGNPRKIKRILNFIQFQLNLSKTIPELQKVIKKLIEKDGQRGEQIFEAMLIEWTIISSYYPDFMRDIIEENGSLLLNMHNFLAGKYEEKELTDEKLNIYLNNEKYEKLLDMIRAFSDTFMSPVMCEKDIKNHESLIEKLFTQNELSEFIINRFSIGVKENLKKENHPEQISKLLVNELNKIINGNYIYDDDFFKGKTKNLIKGKYNVALANRKILESVYPDEIINFKEFELNFKYIIHLSGTVDIESMRMTSEEYTKKDVGKEQILETIGKDEVLQLIKDKKKDSLKGKKLTGIDLSNIDLSGFDLTGAKLNGAIMIDTKLIETNLEGANLYQANLQSATLEHANLRNAILTRTKLTSAKLNKANLENTKLKNAELWRAELNNTNFKRANLEDAILYNAEMVSADFSEANLYNAGMMSATMQGAIFKNANLHCCNFTGAKFDKKTDFRDAKIDSVTIDNLGGSNWDKALWDEYVRVDIVKKYGLKKDIPLTGYRPD